MAPNLRMMGLTLSLAIATRSVLDADNSRTSQLFVGRHLRALPELLANCPSCIV